MLNIKYWYIDIHTITLTSCFDYIDIMLRLRWHSLIKSDKTSRLLSHLLRSEQATLLIEFASRKKLFFSKEKFFFSTFQSHEMKSIDSIFAFSIICFSVYTKFISILLVFVLVVFVLVFVFVLVIVLVLCLVLVLCQKLNQLDEQQTLSLNSSHLTSWSSSERVRIARVLAMLSFRTSVLLQ